VPGIFGYLFRFAALFKDKKFQSEVEWRLVSRGGDRPFDYPSGEPAVIKYRAGRTTLVPYIEVPLKAVKIGVTVGPCPESQLACDAMPPFFGAVSPSEIPFRNG
jgi:hypothetical protein